MTTEPAVPSPPPPAEAPQPRPHPVKKTIAARVWVSIGAAIVLLVLLLDFIFQNLKSVSVHFFGWHGRTPLALALLVSAIAGALIVFLVGATRIIQLRRSARRHEKAHKRAPAAP